MRAAAGQALEDLTFDYSYTSSRTNLTQEFYVPCLDRAARYDRAVGFFSSSLYAVVSAALTRFLERGGKMRLVCSPHLSTDDVEAIQRGLNMRDQIQKNLLADIRLLTCDPLNIPAVELLATLVGANVLDIKIAYRPGKSGLFHSKVGIFVTESASVAFQGSVNETRAAFSVDGSHESFSVFTTWSNEVDKERASEIQYYFDSLWESREPNVEVVELPKLPREELQLYVNPGGVEAAIERVRSTVTEPRERGRNSRKVELMKHQSETLANWEDAGYRGIVQHATGAGKTITALEAIGRWIRHDRPAIVLVPSDILVEQWIDEIKSYLGDYKPRCLIVGGTRSSRGWEQDLPDFTRSATYLGPRIVIATMQSASTRRFTRKVVPGDHLLMVADEVHRMGSPNHRRIMTISAGARLALSATPTRYGDPVGTRAILDYFGEVVEPKFGIPEAILAGRLVPYDYHVVDVELTDEEQEEWDLLTQKVRRAYARLPESDGIKLHSPSYKNLLIRRARILKQASRKTELARSTLACRYRPGERWLVYCDDGKQLTSVLTELRLDNIPAFEYWTGTASALPETLDFFSRNGGVLVAIRCLDEGVDLPNLDHALILASSTNPREFIQRRGRVLRRAPGKYRAIIFDAMVVPNSIEGPEVDRLPILRNELKRASEFANYAQNRISHHRLHKMASDLGLFDFRAITPDFEEDADDA